MASRNEESLFEENFSDDSDGVSDEEVLYSCVINNFDGLAFLYKGCLVYFLRYFGLF
jgi:hypothetical protein